MNEHECVPPGSGDSKHNGDLNCMFKAIRGNQVSIGGQDNLWKQRLPVFISDTEKSFNAFTRYCIVRPPKHCLVDPYGGGGADTIVRPLVYNPGRMATPATSAQTGFLSILSLLGGH